jgi:hypothetical protein
MMKKYLNRQVKWKTTTLMMSQYEPLMSQQTLSLQELSKMHIVRHLQRKKTKNLLMPFTSSIL